MRKIILFIFCFAMANAFGQKVKEYEIDLSETNISLLSRNIKTGNTKFIIKYLVKNEDYYYSITAQEEQIVIEPLEPSKVKETATKSKDSIQIDKKGKLLDNCEGISSRYNNKIKKYNSYLVGLNKISSEKILKDSLENIQLKELINEINNLKKENSKCAKKLLDILSVIKIKSKYYKEIVFNNIRKGITITVLIKKIKKSDNAVLQEWKRIYKAPSKGKWITSFGIGSAININRQTFRAVKQNDSTYILEKDGRRNLYKYYPSIQFSYLSNFSGNFEIAPSGGINLDPKELSAYGGISIVFAQNMILTGGITFHQIDKLKNKYKEADTFIENKDFNDLHEKFFTISPFISLTFRFKSNPF